MSSHDADIVSRAIIVWTGWDVRSWPLREDVAITDAFGGEAAEALLVRIHELKDDFYASDARFTVADLHEMGQKAASDFRAKHPEFDENAIQALAWCYTFDYK